MRGKGINYDTGFLPGEHDSQQLRQQFIEVMEVFFLGIFGNVFILPLAVQPGI